MDSEILTSQSEVDEQFETPHDCFSLQESEIMCQSNEISETTCFSQETSGNSSSEEKSSLDDNRFEEQSAKLEERLKELKEQMSTLKEQLVEEKVAWQKEIEEAVKVAKNVGVTYCCERDQQFYKDHECFKELKSKSEIEVDTVVNEPTLSELAILDYEQKLATYQEALTKAHVEKRNVLKRQLAANVYKRRLLEVEKLCNMELLKVRQNVQYLQPLQALASTWDTSSNSNEITFKFDDELTGNITKSQNETKPPKSNGDGNKSEFVTMEDLEIKIFKDLKEISSQLAPNACNSVLNDNDDMMKNRILSMSWYNNELGPHSPFNPLM